MLSIQWVFIKTLWGRHSQKNSHITSLYINNKVVLASFLFLLGWLQEDKRRKGVRCVARVILNLLLFLIHPPWRPLSSKLNYSFSYTKETSQICWNERSMLIIKLKINKIKIVIKVRSWSYTLFPLQFCTLLVSKS